MKPGRLWFCPFLPISVLLVSLAPAAPGSEDRDNREVRISSVQGDVRLSRGDGKHPDLKQSWEQAQNGQLIEQGFAVATGSGRAEIELENGSTVFLAENSLLLLRKLSSAGERVVTDMTLPTVSASFWLQMAEGESFLLETPTDKMHFSGPHSFFLRFDAYLDATAMTPLGGKLAELVRTGTPNVPITRGQTVFLQGGVLLPAPPGTDETLPSNGSVPSDFALGLPIRAVTAALRDSGISLPSISPRDVFGVEPFGRETSSDLKSEDAQSRPGDQLSDWDQWVEARVLEKETTLAAALKASGLSSPVPGLADLYLHGTFSPCEPYGTCWEPAQSQSVQESAARPGPADAQGQSPNAASPGFRPQTVQWEEPEWSGPCDFLGGSRTISRVARTPEEFKELLGRKSLAESNAYRQIATQESCYRRPWIYRHRHYAMVLPRTPPRCFGPGCKPVHPPHLPHPVFVGVADKVGFVPRHPDDAKNKTPVNLKNGIILLASKPGEPIGRVAWDPSQKLTFLDKSPREFEREFVSHPAPVVAPQIRASLMRDATRGSSLTAANHFTPRIEYDYKTREFMMPAAARAGAKESEVAVGGIASNGKIATFASNQSSRFADSFGRTSAGASYGGSNYASHSSGSGSYGGSSSHSSGSSSSGGSSAHSSSGGGGGGSATSSSGGSSSPAASGGSHPR